jgi:branched-chain amino acid transport system ATP-binding protein
LTASLRVNDLHAGYASAAVLHNVSLDATAGSVVCVMGRNGAGKTTLLRSLMGLIPKQGRVGLNGRDITDWSSHRINRAGMVWVPQDKSVFSGLTVRDHLTIAVHNRGVASGIAAAVSLFAALGPRLDQEAQTLSGGERKMLAIAQALIARPEVILLDEPTEGVAPVVVEELIPAIRHSAEQAAVILVEQNVDTALAVGSTAYVLEHGRVVEKGDIASLHATGVLEERLAL